MAGECVVADTGQAIASQYERPIPLTLNSHDSLAVTVSAWRRLRLHRPCPPVANCTTRRPTPSSGVESQLTPKISNTCPVWVSYKHPHPHPHPHPIRERTCGSWLQQPVGSSRVQRHPHLPRNARRETQPPHGAGAASCHATDPASTNKQHTPKNRCRRRARVITVRERSLLRRQAHPFIGVLIVQFTAPQPR